MKTKRALWEEIRTVFRAFRVGSMTEILEGILNGYEKPLLNGEKPFLAALSDSS